MPSLPSLSGFEEDEPSLDLDSGSEHDGGTDSDLPTHSTPALSHRSSTGSQNPSSTSSTQRFANSFARSRASQSGSRATASKNRSYSFDVSAIPSLPDVHGERGTYHFSEEEDTDDSKDSVPDAYLPPEHPEDDEEEDDMSLSDALQSVSRSNSPYPDEYEPTPKKHFDMVVPLRSEPKVCLTFHHSSNLSLLFSPARSMRIVISRCVARFREHALLLYHVRPFHLLHPRRTLLLIALVPCYPIGPRRSRLLEAPQ